MRILFPGAGLLVLSAWCLGILNSHRKFFLSYTAPVLWNMAMIATLVVFRRHDQRSLAVILAWGSVAGSALQFGVQVPVVLRLARKLRMSLNARAAHVREVIRNFAPVFVSRGVVQISAYVDSLLASLLGEGAVAALTNAQTLSTLPVSLFGMAVSAAELPAMSSALGDEQSVAAYLRRRLNSGLRQIAFFIVPSAMGFLTLGGVITAALFENGKFTHEDSMYVWGILMRERGRAAGVHSRPPVLLHVLCAEGHAHSAAVRRRAGNPDDRAGLSQRRPRAAVDRCRSALGSRGAHGFRGDCGLGGVLSFAENPQPADRGDRLAGSAGGQALGCRRRRRRRGLGREAGDRPTRTDRQCGI